MTDAAPAGTGEASVSRSARSRLRTDMILLGIVGLVLIAAIAAGAAAMYRIFYSPSAFVERYVGLLADGRAAEALAIPGVAVDSAELDAAGLSPDVSDALLRRAALAELTDIRVVSEQPRDGGVVDVTVTYIAGGYEGTTTFEVEREGTVGVAPTWRFAESPLALIELEVSGSMVFEVNGFSVDKRQVSPDGVDADPRAPVPLLVFSPGLYSVSVDTAISSTPGVAVLSDLPLTRIPVSIIAQPTDEFLGVVQQRMEEFLTRCATQQVLQPTACPFGFPVEDRITSLPKWSIIEQPSVTVESDGAGWRIPPAQAVAHIEVDVQSLFDGTITHVVEDVPFIVTGRITVLPDGTASILVTGPDTQ
ncbi:hypothetical protein [Microbacterium immunditiarum]|nr:hypothetical protein [Microbacterium immunditiarum]